MKELQQHIKVSEATRHEVTVKKKQEIEYVLTGNITPKNGHKVFEINEFGEVLEAEYKKDTTVFNINAVMLPKKLVIKPNCVYIPALNAANAKRKYNQNKNQSAYYTKSAPSSINEITF